MKTQDTVTTITRQKEIREQFETARAEFQKADTLLKTIKSNIKTLEDEISALESLQATQEADKEKNLMEFALGQKTHEEMTRFREEAAKTSQDLVEMSEVLRVSRVALTSTISKQAKFRNQYSSAAQVYWQIIRKEKIQEIRDLLGDTINELIAIATLCGEEHPFPLLTGELLLINNFRPAATAAVAKALKIEHDMEV